MLTRSSSGSVPSISSSLPHCFLPPGSCFPFSLYPCPHQGTSAGVERRPHLHSNYALILEWQALMEEKRAYFWELAEASTYLNRAKEEKRKKTVFATSNELQTIPHPPLTWLRSYFPLSTLSLTTLPLCKSFLGFVLKGQGSQKGGATELEKIPTSNYTGAHVPGLTCLPTLGGRQLATGTQLGLLDSWPWQLQK